ncbi:MAG: hypothetical protein AAFP19_19370 [Bacteroidota bacterium]
MKTAIFTSLLTLFLALFSTSGLQAQICNPSNCNIEWCKKLFETGKATATKATCNTVKSAEAKALAVGQTTKTNCSKTVKADNCRPNCCKPNVSITSNETASCKGKKASATACAKKEERSKPIADLSKKVALN